MARLQFSPKLADCARADCKAAVALMLTASIAGIFIHFPVVKFTARVRSLFLHTVVQLAGQRDAEGSGIISTVPGYPQNISALLPEYCAIKAF